MTPIIPHPDDEGPILSRRDIAESPLPHLLAIAGAAALYGTLPDDIVTGGLAGVFDVARYVVPSLAGILLASLLVTFPSSPLLVRLEVEARRVWLTRRYIQFAAAGLMTLANGAATILLVHLLVSGAHVRAAPLLSAGIRIWCSNVLVFSLWFWLVDGGGPLDRLANRNPPDFQFPQQQGAGTGWRPRFLDYLYVAYTNASAFSPTDAMPLTHRAKMLMLVQSAASLTLAVLVAARAVNILG